MKFKNSDRQIQEMGLMIACTPELDFYEKLWFPFDNEKLVFKILEELK